MPNERATQDRHHDLVSVILPVRNGADVVLEQLVALLAQTYAGPWELVVVDNGSSDGSAALVTAGLDRPRPDGLVDAKVVEFVERFGHASPRNHGVEVSAGSWLVFCDADDVVTPSWLDRLVGERRRGVVTASRFVPLDDHEQADQGDSSDIAPTQLFGIPVVHTGGMLVSRHDFLAVGGFDADFDRGGADADFSIRAHLAGIQATIAPSAVYQVRRRDSTGSAVRQAYRYGRSRTRLFARHSKAIGYPPSDWVLVLRRLRDVIRRSPDLLSGTRRPGYMRMVSNVTARLIWSARLRVRYF